MTPRDAHGDAIDKRQGARGVCSVSRLLLSAREPCLPGALLRGSPSKPPGPCWLFRKISLLLANPCWQVALTASRSRVGRAGAF